MILCSFSCWCTAYLCSVAGWLWNKSLEWYSASVMCCSLSAKCFCTECVLCSRLVNMCSDSAHSMYHPLQRRGLYEALSPEFCACSGVLKISFYCVQKLGIVHQTADSCTPSDSQAHFPGRQKLLRGNWAPSFGLCSGHSGDLFPTRLDP